MNHNNDTQTHQQNRDDKLQSFYHKDSGSGIVSLYQCDAALNECGEGNAQHNNQRNQQRAVFAAGDA